jgi:hypothetical protein
LDAALGLRYLHNKIPAIVHFGLRTDDILIDDTGRGILGGFGWTSVRFNLPVGADHVFITIDDLAGDQRQPDHESHRSFKRAISVFSMRHPLTIWHILTSVFPTGPRTHRQHALPS